MHRSNGDPHRPRPAGSSIRSDERSLREAMGRTEGGKGRNHGYTETGRELSHTNFDVSSSETHRDPAMVGEVVERATTADRPISRPIECGVDANNQHGPDHVHRVREELYHRQNHVKGVGQRVSGSSGTSLKLSPCLVRILKEVLCTEIAQQPMLARVYHTFAQAVGLEIMTGGAESVQHPPTEPRSTRSGTSTTLHAIQHQGDAQRSTISSLRDKLSRSEAETRRLQGDLQRTEHFSRAKHDEAVAAKEMARRAQSEVAMMSHHLGRLSEELSEAKRLLATRTDELRIAQNFMSTADQFSMADIRQAVEELNEEIYQIAVFVTDDVLPQSRSQPELDEAARAKQSRKDRHLIEERWGRSWFERVRGELNEGDSVLFEALVRTLLVEWCALAIGTFALQGSSTGKFLDRLWDDIRQDSESPVC